MTPSVIPNPARKNRNQPDLPCALALRLAHWRCHGFTFKADVTGHLIGHQHRQLAHQLAEATVIRVDIPQCCQLVLDERMLRYM